MTDEIIQSVKALLGWSSKDEALAFKIAYERLGYGVTLEAEWSPHKQDGGADE